MKVQDREFEFLVASNLEPDEMNLELWELRSGKRVMVAEVSYAEGDRSMTFRSYERDLPFEVVEQLVETARLRLPPMEA